MKTLLLLLSVAFTINCMAQLPATNEEITKRLNTSGHHLNRSANMLGWGLGTAVIGGIAAGVASKYDTKVAFGIGGVTVACSFGFSLSAIINLKRSSKALRGELLSPVTVQ